MKKFNRFLNGLLLILSLATGIFVVEIGLRVFKIEYPIFQTFDFHRGFALRSGSSGWWLREGKAHVKINRDGLRDREHEKVKPKKVLRIAVLGDSFAEARSISLEKTFWFLVEKKLNSCSNHGYEKVEVINFGVSEYSTAQELLTLRYHVWDYNPDLVLLAFFSGNDVADNSKILSKKKYRPFFIYKNDKLVLDNSFRNSKPYLLLKSTMGQIGIKLSSYSRIVQLTREIYVRQYFKYQARKKNTNTQFIKMKKDNNKNVNYEAGTDYNQLYQPTLTHWKEAWRVTESIIKLMNEEIKEKKAQFIIVTLSTSIQVHPDPLYRKNFIKSLGVEDLFYPDKRIKRLGDEEDILVLNLAEQLQVYAEENQIFLHGFDNTTMGEGHWNVDGHNIASHIISQKLCKSFGNLNE